jgi:hypothetical protein
VVVEVELVLVVLMMVVLVEELVVIEHLFQEEQKLSIENGTSYPITVGGGGAGQVCAPGEI